jgi:hypothetical protein
VAVDQPLGGFDSGLIINTIQSNHANGSVVSPDNICTIDCHLDLQAARDASSVNFVIPAQRCGHINGAIKTPCCSSKARRDR